MSILSDIEAAPGEPRRFDDIYRKWLVFGTGRIKDVSENEFIGTTYIHAGQTAILAKFLKYGHRAYFTVLLGNMRTAQPLCCVLL